MSGSRTIAGRASSEFLLDVGLGRIPGHSVLFALGEREGMGTTAAGEDVWRGNDLTPAPTSHVLIPTPASAGEQMTLVSEAAGDDSVGTGIQTVTIHYLDAAGDPQNETIALDGITPVNTVATDIRFVQDMHAATVGSGGVAAGHVKIYKTGTAGDVYDMIALGGNKSLVPHRMVPRGHKLALMGWSATEAKNRRCAFRIRSTDFDGTILPGVFLFKGVAYLNQSSSVEMSIPVIVPALSIVKVSAWPDAIGSDGSCHWWGFLVDERFTP